MTGVAGYRPGYLSEPSAMGLMGARPRGPEAKGCHDAAGAGPTAGGPTLPRSIVIV